MDEVKSQFEICLISKAIGLPFEDLDFVVETLERSSGDAMPEIRQEAGEVLSEGISQLDEMFESKGLCLIDPCIEEDSCCFGIWEIPEHTEVLLEQVGLVQRFVDLHKFHEAFQ